jgi:hypothetical protein
MINLTFRAKLTKKFFMCLDPGLLLTSNCIKPCAKPGGGIQYKSIFRERVSPEAREIQWKAIVAAGANGRLCWASSALNMQLPSCVEALGK